jgi:hypothetical protein
MSCKGNFVQDVKLITPLKTGVQERRNFEIAAIKTEIEPAQTYADKA